jgi:phage-related protein
MPHIGSRVNEIRIQETAGIFRVIYVAKFSDAVHVLHCFQKKDKQTPPADIDLAKDRYKALTAEQALKKTEKMRKQRNEKTNFRKYLGRDRG